MTKKDYVKIADVFAKNAPMLPPTWAMDEAGRQLDDLYQRTVRRMADMLQADNPRFDRARFYKACGVDNGNA